jgi:glycosyltransferase involved in cell wall biosynthesis
MAYKNISVILTTYNGAAYIKKQLDSMLHQTLQPAEIIICDDQSTDDTVSVINTYLKDNRIKLYLNVKRLGVVANFQKAAGLASIGNWLAFADQDDIWLPHKLKTLADELVLLDDDTIPAMVYSDLKVINKNDEVIANSFWEKQEIRPMKIKLATLLYGNVAVGCTMMINYPMAAEFLKMDNHNYLHDEWLALISYTFGKAKHLTEQLVLYRQHENNITFSESYEASRGNPLSEIFKHLLGEKEFLPHQYAMVKAFLSIYRDKLNELQIKTFESFIKWENRNYILQRLNRRRIYL